MKAETSLPCGGEICQEVTAATESLGPSHSTCFLGPASPAKRVKPSRLPAAELLWLLVLDKNIDFLWCCAMHVRWTGVISSHALRRRGKGEARGWSILCSSLFTSAPHSQSLLQEISMLDFSPPFIFFKCLLCFCRGSSYSGIILFLTLLVL